MNTNKNEDNIGFLIKQISDKMRARADADMKCSGLTYSQFLVLGFVENSGGETSQKEIEDFLGVSHPTVVGLISRLKAKGFVETATDQKDKRIKLIRITDKAKQLSDYMCSKRNQAEAMLKSGLSDDEFCELLRLLRIVYSNIKDTDPVPSDQTHSV